MHWSKMRLRGSISQKRNGGEAVSGTVTSWFHKNLRSWSCFWPDLVCSGEEAKQTQSCFLRSLESCAGWRNCFPALYLLNGLSFSGHHRFLLKLSFISYSASASGIRSVHRQAGKSKKPSLLPLCSLSCRSFACSFFLGDSPLPYEFIKNFCPSVQFWEECGSVCSLKVPNVPNNSRLNHLALLFCV